MHVWGLQLDFRIDALTSGAERSHMRQAAGLDEDTSLESLLSLRAQLAAQGEQQLISNLYMARHASPAQCAVASLFLPFLKIVPSGCCKLSILPVHQIQSPSLTCSATALFHSGH